VDRKQEARIGFDAPLAGASASREQAQAAGADSNLGSAGAGTLQVEDLINYGFLPEFVGRFPVHAKLAALTQDQMVHVMTTPRNALLKQYQALFAADGVSLQLTTGAVDAIAEQADRSKTGARGLRTIVEQALNDAMYNLTNWRSRGVTHVIVTAETITEGRPPMLYPEPVEQLTAEATGAEGADAATEDDKEEDEQTAATG